MKAKNVRVTAIQGVQGGEEMKDITSSVSYFENLIEGNFLYVDKTEYVWKLIRSDRGMYFLSRPRRFGKSLLVSTLKAIFEGKRELFQGLAIHDKPYGWKKHPVIHLSFGDFSPTYNSAKAVEEYLLDKVNYIAESLSVGPLKAGKSPKAFFELIDRLARGGEQVVILVDEYDKPILDNIDNKRVSAILNVLKGFYSVLKDCGQKERLLFITGVSKFSHVSLFSNLNNLTDITLDPDYAGMLGFTEAEIREHFAEVIPAAAKENGYDNENLMALLLKWYDGYRFSKADTHVCNPVSIVNFFYHSYIFSSYWDSTGTPSFLLKLMQKHSYDLENELEKWHDEAIFAAYELNLLNITGLLWQTGYLTIKDVRHDGERLVYRLGFPDKEVQYTFMLRLVNLYTGMVQRGDSVPVWDFRRAISEDDLDGFMTLFKSFLANIDYSLHIPAERYYQTTFYIFFLLLGAEITAEARTNIGRVDACIRTPKTVYIFEFKLNKTAEKAVTQIIDKHYCEKFLLSGLPIRLVGVNFNYSKGDISAWKELPAPAR